MQFTLKLTRACNGLSQNTIRSASLKTDGAARHEIGTNDTKSVPPLMAVVIYLRLIPCIMMTKVSLIL